MKTTVFTVWQPLANLIQESFTSGKTTRVSTVCQPTARLSTVLLRHADAYCPEKHLREKRRVSCFHRNKNTCDLTSSHLLHLLSEFLLISSLYAAPDDYHVLVWILKGSLAFTTILAGFLAVLLYKVHKSRSAPGGGKCFLRSWSNPVMQSLLLCFVSGSDLGFSACHPMNAEVPVIWITQRLHCCGSYLYSACPVLKLEPCKWGRSPLRCLQDKCGEQTKKTDGRRKWRVCVHKCKASSLNIFQLSGTAFVHCFE